MRRSRRLSKTAPRDAGGRLWCEAQAGWMFSACMPFGPRTASNCTFWPSSRLLYPDPAIAEWWAKRSALPSSGAMKPYPLSALNHFTVPVVMCFSLFFMFTRRDAAGVAAQRSGGGGGRIRRRGCRRRTSVGPSGRPVAGHEGACERVEGRAADLVHVTHHGGVGA